MSTKENGMTPGTDLHRFDMSLGSYICDNFGVHLRTPWRPCAATISKGRGR
jgi:hypothetical protein